MIDYAAARLNLVESQVRPNNVRDRRLIAAMSEIPRELFVPQALRGVAYMDEDIKISEASDAMSARYLMEPRVFAKLVDLCQILPSDLVLDIGCGTGYSTAVLARLASTVVALEADEKLATQADETLAELGIDNAAMVRGPLKDGYPGQGPYDVILLNGSVPAVPASLKQQLKDGGRLVAVETGAGAGSARLYVRSGEVVSGRAVFDAMVAPLPGFELAERFQF